MFLGKKFQEMYAFSVVSDKKVCSREKIKQIQKIFYLMSCYSEISTDGGVRPHREPRGALRVRCASKIALQIDDNSEDILISVGPRVGAKKKLCPPQVDGAVTSSLFLPARRARPPHELGARVRPCRGHPSKLVKPGHWKAFFHVFFFKCIFPHVFVFKCIFPRVF